MTQRTPGDAEADRRAIFHVSVSMAARIWTAGATAVITILVVQLVDVETAGAWFFVVASANLLSIAAMAGVPGVAVRRLASAQFATASIVRSSMRVVGVTVGVLVFGLIGPVGFVLADRFESAGAWHVPAGIALLVVARTAQRLVSDLARGVLELNLAAALSGASSLSFTGIVLATMLASGLDVGLLEIVAVEASCTLVIAVAASFLLRPRLMRWVTDGEDGSFRFRDTRWLAVHNVTTQVVLQGDVIVAGFVLTAAAVSDLGVALRIAAFLALPMQVINSVLAPSMSSYLASRRDAQLTALIRALVVKATIAVVAGAVLIALLGPAVISAVFGSEYDGAFILLLVLIVGQLVTTVTGPSAQLLIATEHDRTAARNGALAGAIIIVGCAVGGLAFGAIGVAACSAGASVVQNMLNWAIARQRTGLRTDAFA